MTTTAQSSFLFSSLSRLVRALGARASVVAIAVAALVTFSARESRADQFVLFDATFTFTWDDAMNSTPSKSHFYVTEKNFLNKMRPANLASPINYGAGTVHIHLEVIDRPMNTQQTGWALCYVDNAGHYGCPYTDYYTKTGIYEKNADMKTFFNANTINWASGVSEVDLVYTIDGSGMGHITNYPALKDLVTPTTVRIALVQVSPGSTYDPSILPALDGGTVSTSDSGVMTRDGGLDGASLDAMMNPNPGTGGAAGSVGTSGAGGSGEAGAGGSGSTTTTTTTGAGGAGGSGTTQPPVEDAGFMPPTQPGDTSGGPQSGCSCSVHPRSGNAAAAWALFGLLGLARRRRRPNAMVR